MVFTERWSVQRPVNVGDGAPAQTPSCDRGCQRSRRLGLALSAEGRRGSAAAVIARKSGRLMLRQTNEG